jgi:dihydroorotase
MKNENGIKGCRHCVAGISSSRKELALTASVFREWPVLARRYTFLSVHGLDLQISNISQKVLSRAQPVELCMASPGP